MTIELAVSAETVHVGLPFLERVRRIADRGLQVEIWDWSNHLDDLDELAAMDAEVVSMTGYLRGNLTDDDAIPELLATAEESLRVAEKLRCPRLNLHGTGLDGRGLPVRPVETVTGAMWARATVTLQRLAALGEREGRVFTLENLNLAVDHPGTPFARAEDTLALVSAVDSPGLRMNLDLPGTEDPMSDIAHAADRLTMGIVIAGLFIGSSILYYARVQPIVFGIPVIGIIGYIVALVLGLWIISQIMNEQRHRRR